MKHHANMSNTASESTSNDAGGGHATMRGTLPKCMTRCRDFVRQAQRAATDAMPTEGEKEEPLLTSSSKSSSLMKAKEFGSSLKRELLLNGLEM